MSILLRYSHLLIAILSLLISTQSYSQEEETCSRVAIINYQEVLVDANSNQKGEGLRFYLEKDKVAKKYLDDYQEGNRVRFRNAAIGTIGTSLIIGGLLTNSEGNSKRTLLVGGASLLIINFLVAKTLEFQNEKNINKAVDEYNKRNLPQIYFKPDSTKEKNSGGWGLFKSWSF